MTKKLLFIIVLLYCGFSIVSQDFIGAASREDESKGIFSLFSMKTAMSAIIPGPSAIEPDLESITADLQAQLEKRKGVTDPEEESKIDEEIATKIDELYRAKEQLQNLQKRLAIADRGKKRQQEPIKLIGSVSYDLGDNSAVPVVGAIYSLVLKQGDTCTFDVNAMLKITPIAVGTGDEEVTDMYLIKGGNGELSLGLLGNVNIASFVKLEAKAAAVGALVITNDDSVPDNNKNQFTFRLDGTANIWLWDDIYFGAVLSVNNLISDQAPTSTADPITYKLLASFGLGKDFYLNFVWTPEIEEGVLFGVSKVFKKL